jgi:hypothetical protein
MTYRIDRIGTGKVVGFFAGGLSVPYSVVLYVL